LPQVVKGDLICVIFSSGVPVPLCKIISDEMTGEHYYRFPKGRCIHGVMDGE
jgi:hypothetical protein